MRSNLDFHASFINEFDSDLYLSILISIMNLTKNILLILLIMECVLIALNYRTDWNHTYIVYFVECFGSLNI